MTRTPDRSARRSGDRGGWNEDQPGSGATVGKPAPPEGGVGSGAGIAEFVTDNVAACAASAAILSRGFQFINRARLRAYLMGVDDGLRIVRAMCLARTGREWIGLERQLYMRASSWTVSRTLMLAVMAVQLGEDAVVPLARRLDAVFDLAA